MNEEPKGESVSDVCRQLRESGWRVYPNQFKVYAKCFYKDFETPTRCACNDGKPGIQIEIAVSDRLSGSSDASIEMTLNGQLKDGTWVSFQNYSLPSNYNDVINLIPRMLRIWEEANK